MEKKEYKRPIVSAVHVQPSMMLCLSGVDSNKGIGYGGTDDAGAIDPATREKVFAWDCDFDWE